MILTKEDAQRAAKHLVSLSTADHADLCDCFTAIGKARIGSLLLGRISPAGQEEIDEAETTIAEILSPLKSGMTLLVERDPSAL